MKDVSIYCMSTNNENLEIIKSLNYIPVGLRNNNFSLSIENFSQYETMLYFKYSIILFYLIILKKKKC